MKKSSCCLCCRKPEIPIGMKMENGVLVHDIKCTDITVTDMTTASEVIEISIENI